MIGTGEDPATVAGGFLVGGSFALLFAMFEYLVSIRWMGGYRRILQSKRTDAPMKNGVRWSDCPIRYRLSPIATFIFLSIAAMLFIGALLV